MPFSPSGVTLSAGSAVTWGFNRLHGDSAVQVLVTSAQGSGRDTRYRGPAV